MSILVLTVLKIRFNAAAISPEQIINLLNWAGFHCGIGGWRHERGGTFGQYHVVPPKGDKK